MSAAPGRGAPDVRVVFTIGHSTRPWPDFVSLLERHRVARVADVRAFPGSRRYPHFGRDVMPAALAPRGIDYVHLPALGGRRRPDPASPNTAWRNPGFRAYADYMATPEFAAAVDHLLALAADRPTAIMCSEAVPWRCHRTLVADALVARGTRVLHVLDAGATPHTLTRFATVVDGRVRYDLAAEQGGLFPTGDAAPGAA